MNLHTDLSGCLNQGCFPVHWYTQRGVLHSPDQYLLQFLHVCVTVTFLLEGMASAKACGLWNRRYDSHKETSIFLIAFLTVSGSKTERVQFAVDLHLIAANPFLLVPSWCYPHTLHFLSNTSHFPSFFPFLTSSNVLHCLNKPVLKQSV